MKNFTVRRRRLGLLDPEDFVDVTEKVVKITPLRWEIKPQSGCSIEQTKVRIGLKQDSFSYVTDTLIIEWEITFEDVEGNTVKFRGISHDAEYIRQDKTHWYTISQFEYLDLSGIASDDSAYFQGKQITCQNLPDGLYWITVKEISPFHGCGGYGLCIGVVDISVKGITCTGEMLEGEGIVQSGRDGEITVGEGSLIFTQSGGENVLSTNIFMFAIKDGAVKSLKNGGILSLPEMASMFGSVDDNLPSISLEDEADCPTSLTGSNRGFDVIAVPVEGSIVYLETFADFDENGYTTQWGVRSSNTDLIPDLVVSDTNMVRFIRLFKAVDDDGNVLGVIAVQFSGEDGGAGSYMYIGVITRLWVLDINDRIWISVDINDEKQFDVYTFQLVGSKNDEETPFIWAICANSAKDGTSTDPRKRTLYALKIKFGSSPSVSVDTLRTYIDETAEGVKQLINTAYFDVVNKEYGIIVIEKVKEGTSQDALYTYPLLRRFKIVNTAGSQYPNLEMMRKIEEKPLYLEGRLMTGEACPVGPLTKGCVVGDAETSDFPFGVPALSKKIPATGEIVGVLPQYCAGLYPGVKVFAFVISEYWGYVNWETDYRLNVGVGWDYALIIRYDPDADKYETGLFYGGLTAENLFLWYDCGFYFFAPSEITMCTGLGDYDFWLKKWVGVSPLEAEWFLVKHYKYYGLLPPSSAVYNSFADLCRGVACVPAPDFSDTGGISLWRTDGSLSFAGSPPFGRENELDYDGSTYFSVIEEKSVFYGVTWAGERYVVLGSGETTRDTLYIKSEWLKAHGGEARFKWENYYEFWYAFWTDLVAIREVTLKEYILYPMHHWGTTVSEKIIGVEYQPLAGLCKVKSLSKIAVKSEA